MAGLNNLLSDTQQTTTTMPAWYDQAQQNIVSGGNTAAAAAPTLGQTTAQGAINTLQGPNNPFTQAQGSLQQISSGAANPWIVDQATGQVNPNVNTAMGGLFQAQRQELNQLMPEYTAPAQAQAIGSGNFGSLRGQTAVEKAKGDAFAKLNAAQLQAALSNQQVGSQAAANLGNVGQQGINAGMNVGLEQMNAPFHTIGNQASLLGTLQAPTTVSSQKQLSPLGQVATIGNAVTGGTAGLNSLLSSLGIKGGLSGLSGLFGGSGSGTPAVTYGTDAATQQAQASGATPVDDNGNLMPGWTMNSDGSYSYSSSNIVDTSGNTGGGGTTGTEQDLYNAESPLNTTTDQAATDYQTYYDNLQG